MMSKKPKSIADQIAELSNPAPLLDPEDSLDIDTVAKVTSLDDDEDDDFIAQSSYHDGRIRKQAATFLEQSDERYSGKTTSRSAILDDSDSGSSEEDEEEDSDTEMPKVRSKLSSMIDDGEEAESDEDSDAEMPKVRSELSSMINDGEEAESDEDEHVSFKEHLRTIAEQKSKKVGGKEAEGFKENGGDCDDDEHDISIDDDDDDGDDGSGKEDDDDDDSDEGGDDDGENADREVPVMKERHSEYGKVWQRFKEMSAVSAEQDSDSAGSSVDEDEGEVRSDGSDDDDDDDDDDEDDDDPSLSPQAFSSVNVEEEVLKGKAAKVQLGLWDSFMETRIKLQKAVHTTNQLPQYPAHELFMRNADEEVEETLAKSHQELKALLKTLVNLQESLLLQNPETQHIATGEKEVKQVDSDEEIPSDDEDDAPKEEKKTQPLDKRQGVKRKLNLKNPEEYLAKRHKEFEDYRNRVIQTWYDKTKLSTGKFNSKSFSSFDKSALLQIQQILQDKERLVRRTQLKRTSYQVLGKEEQKAGGKDKDENEDIPTEQNTHLKDYDPEIFDDDDFYHQLLRELIEKRTSDITDPVQLTRQWLAVQKLRSKVKRIVDTKASKGRKIRYDVHTKLVSFMAPHDDGTMLEDARNELFKSLFGADPFTSQPAR